MRASGCPLSESSLGKEGGPQEQLLSCLCRCVAMMMKGLEPSNINDFYLTGRKVRTARTGQVVPGGQATAPRLWEIRRQAQLPKKSAQRYRHKGKVFCFAK